MRIYIGFDDTDTINTKRGTGRLARMFEDRLPEGVKLIGVLRQQLPNTIPGIPFTSHNSSACVIVDAPGPEMAETLVDLATRHLRENYVEGSDPGLCVAEEGCACRNEMMEFGRTCCSRIVRQNEAMAAARTVHRSGHGGTNDGIIGAVAGVGLTMLGWSGRFIEFGRLREFPETVSVGDLERAGMHVMGAGRDAMVLTHDDMIRTEGWLRPKLIAGVPVVMVVNDEQGWRVVGKKGFDGAGQ